MTINDEARKSNIISGAAIARNVSDDNFEALIEEIRNMSSKERIEAGINNFGIMLDELIGKKVEKVTEDRKSKYKLKI